jgi:myxalamid-type polyketide synthase MxaB
MVANQTAERFAQVMAPKVAGAWHLHQLTQQMPLDFFVCFSSDSSLLGYASQTHYSAANAFLDALSHHRQAQGLPGLTINWGPWGEVGISSRVSDNYQHRMMIHGRYFLPVRLALQALDIVFAQPLPQVAVLPIDWNRWAQTLPLSHPWPFVANLVETTAETTVPSPSTTSETTETFLTQIFMVPVAERRAVLEYHLRTLIGQALGTSTAQLGRDQGFFDYGMDSLTSIELRNLLQVGLDAKLPQTMAFTYPTIEALSNYLINDVLDIEFGPISDEIAEDEDASTATQTILANEISELSDAEAEDELLRELERLDQMS